MGNKMSRDKAIGIGFITGVVVVLIGILTGLLFGQSQKGEYISLILMLLIFFPSLGMGWLVFLIRPCNLFHPYAFVMLFAVQGLTGGIIGYLLWKFSKENYSAWRLVKRIAIILMIIGAISFLMSLPGQLSRAY